MAEFVLPRNAPTRIEVQAVHDVPRPRLATPLPASSPFDCWVDVPAALRRPEPMTGTERAHALADWVEDVGAMNLATELLRTREVVAVLLAALKARGIDPITVVPRAADAIPGRAADPVKDTA